MIARERGGYIGKEKPKVGDGVPELSEMIARAAKNHRKVSLSLAEFFAENFARIDGYKKRRAPIGASARENLRRYPPHARRISRRISGRISRGDSVEILRICGQKMSYSDSCRCSGF